MFPVKCLNEAINHVITCLTTKSSQDELCKHVKESAIMGPGICPFEATKLKEGIEQGLHL